MAVKVGDIGEDLGGDSQVEDHLEKGLRIDDMCAFGRIGWVVMVRAHGHHPG